MTEQINSYLRIKRCITSAVPAALKSARFLLSIMIPVSLAVTLLQYAGILKIIASYMDPLFRFAGMPGDAAIVFLTSITLNIYSAIAVISTIPFTERELTILALACLISHSYFIETPIQKKTGSSAVKMVTIRFIYSFIGAVSLNFLLPAGSGKIITAVSSTAAEASGIKELLYAWMSNSLFLIFEILIIVTLLMIMQRVLDEFGINERLSKTFSPMMKLMGLPESVTFLWIVAYTVGLAYGSAVMLEESENGRLGRGDADLLNHHIAISHSLLEDTLLFVAIGVPAMWIIFPRIILAVAELWLLKIRRVIMFRRESAFAAE